MELEEIIKLHQKDNPNLDLVFLGRYSKSWYLATKELSPNYNVEWALNSNKLKSPYKYYGVWVNEPHCNIMDYDFTKLNNSNFTNISNHSNLSDYNTNT